MFVWSVRFKLAIGLNNAIIIYSTACVKNPCHRKMRTQTQAPMGTAHVCTRAVRPPFRVCGGTRCTTDTLGPTTDTNGRVDGMSADVGGACRGPCLRALFPVCVPLKLTLLPAVGTHVATQCLLSCVVRSVSTGSLSFCCRRTGHPN